MRVMLNLKLKIKTLRSGVFYGDLISFHFFTFTSIPT